MYKRLRKPQILGYGMSMRTSTLAVCTRPNFHRFVPLRFCVAKIWPGTRLGSFGLAPIINATEVYICMFVQRLNLGKLIAKQALIFL